MTTSNKTKPVTKTSRKRRRTTKKTTPKKRTKRVSAKAQLKKDDALRKMLNKEELKMLAEYGAKEYGGAKKKPSRSGGFRRVDALRPNIANIEELAGNLGYNDLAKALTTEHPKAVFPDLSRNNGQVTTKRTDETVSIEEGFSDLFSGSKGDTGLAAYIATSVALEKVVRFEELVAEATKEYWQAKRKLLLVTKTLASAYKGIENEDVDDAKMPTPEEVKSIIIDAFENELFPDTRATPASPGDTRTQ